MDWNENSNNYINHVQTQEQDFLIINPVFIMVQSFALEITKQVRGLIRDNKPSLRSAMWTEGAISRLDLVS